MIGILGAGGQADEISSYIGKNNIFFYAVNEEYINREDIININTPTDEQKKHKVVAAVGAPNVRKKLIDVWSGKSYTNIISKNAHLDGSIKIGVGCMIAPNVVITTDVELGDHILINLSATISHNCKIGSYTTIGPGVNIGGRVRINKGVFIGIGASIKNDLVIAEGVVLGAGAVLIKDANVENGVYVGNPAKLVKKNSGWLNEI